MTQSSRAVPETGVVEELRAVLTDWNGADLPDAELPRVDVLCGTLRRAADALEAAVEVRDLWKQQHSEATKTKEMWQDSYLREKDRATTAERALDEAMAALREKEEALAGVMRMTGPLKASLWNMRVENMLDERDRSLGHVETIEDRARAVLSSVQPVSGSREQRGNEEG